MGDKEPIVIDPFSFRRPISWPDVFGREAPLELEIGFGRGDFLLQRSRERPDINIIGFEISSLSVMKAWRRLARESVSNVRIAKAESASALFYFVPERSLSRTWILFPEPWPKARHEKRRLLSRDFFRILASRTADGGELLLATDWPQYRDWIISEASASGAFSIESRAWPVPATKYHEKWRGEGREIYSLLFIKSHHPDASGLFPEEVEMSQIKIEGCPDLASAVAGFSPVEERWGQGVLRIMKAYLSQDAGEALFLCLTSEEGFIQKFHLSAKRVGDIVLVKPQDHAHLIITHGVKRCVEALANMLNPGS